MSQDSSPLGSTLEPVIAPFFTSAGKETFLEVMSTLSEESSIGAVQVSRKLLSAVLRYASQKGLSVIADDGQITIMGMVPLSVSKADKLPR